MKPDNILQESLIRLRSQDFLARTGDRPSILKLLKSIGDPDPKISQYSLDKVFKNPLAYQELMDPTSLVRVQVIQAYSENNPDRAISFSIDSLAQDDPDLKLLALDVLDCNIAYLEPSLELQLKKLLHDPSERVRVKASRLLVLLSNYEDIDLSDTPALEILERALDSTDLYCRQMSYGMPASIFYKIKNVKSTIDSLRYQLEQRESQLTRVRDELHQARALLRSQKKADSSFTTRLESLETANQMLSEQMSKYTETLRERDELIQRERRAREQLQQLLTGERKARAHEVEQAKVVYENLVAEFQQREDKFKQYAYDFYLRFSNMFKGLIVEKEELLDEIYRHSGQDWTDGRPG